ncbi:hypothetical protein NSMM_370028 [Nitrosomonas mobilis]|uniref:Uncharacterized protein n=1 Tax=Nitrosomonas mobilis TaxID=51642 RepID=A0A1G5SFS7_9PROT|nr:hypothetical protein NSMM_370028 [Nitrosomonas mobilis]
MVFAIHFRFFNRVTHELTIFDISYAAGLVTAACFAEVGHNVIPG